jgi:hypothetical protein
MPELTSEILESIILHNTTERDNRTCQFFNMKSLFNHEKTPNVEVRYITD